MRRIVKILLMNGLVFLFVVSVSSLSLAQPRIDRGIRPTEGVTIPDNPQIREFSVTPTSALVGGQITLRWRVEPGPVERKPITNVMITSPTLGINLRSGEATGESPPMVISSRVEPGRYQITLVATDQAGGQTSRAVDVQVAQDEPIIREFSTDLTIIAAGHDLRLRWRVESQPGGSRIRTIRIAPDITGDLPSSGERTVRIDTNASSQRKRYTLTATNEAGRSITRNVDVEIKSMRDMYAAITIEGLRTEPREFGLEQSFNFMVTINNASGARFNASNLSVSDNRGLVLTPPDTSAVINPGVNRYTVRYINPGGVRGYAFTGFRVWLGYFEGIGSETRRIRDFSVRQVRQVTVYTVE